MDWTAVGTILATGAVTWGSVWLKGRYDDRADARRIANERAESEAQQTAADRRERVAKEEAVTERQRAEAESAMHEFGDILNSLGAYGDNSTPRVIEDAWTRDFAARARLAAERITNAEFRAHIQRANDSLVNFVWFAEANKITDWPGFNAKRHVQMMVQLAGHAVRGDDPSDELQADLIEMRERVEKADNYDEQEADQKPDKPF